MRRPAVLSESTLNWLVPVLAVLLTLFLLYVLGFFTANVFGRRIIARVERLFERVPLVKTVYKSIKQIVLAIGGFQSMHFQRVVLIEFPAPGYKRVAFLTSVMDDRDTGRRIASIFIPYTPYLTTGYDAVVPLGKRVGNQLDGRAGRQVGDVRRDSQSIDRGVRQASSGSAGPVAVRDRSRRAPAQGVSGTEMVSETSPITANGLVRKQRGNQPRPG